MFESSSCKIAFVNLNVLNSSGSLVVYFEIFVHVKIKREERGVREKVGEGCVRRWTKHYFLEHCFVFYASCSPGTQYNYTCKNQCTENKSMYCSNFGHVLTT